MDSTSMNPYEEQLYTVFKTFDVDNEEALNKSAVLDLCDALQLEDRGATLVDNLFERRSDRVTFTQFRNGLLSVLSGAERSPASAPATAPVATPATLVPPVGAAHSDEDSSGREVAPKFVFGSKKYGRRSRPQRSSTSGSSPRAASVSRLDSEDRNRSSQRMRCRRSASAMESRDLDTRTDEDDVVSDTFDHDRRIDCDQALALCRNLQMEGIDRNLLESIFVDSRAEEITVGDFFDRLNVSLTSSIEGSRNTSTAEVIVDDGSDEDAVVAAELVVDAWERAGVPRPRRLLVELGFIAAAVRPLDLERVLDDELAAFPEPVGERRDGRSTLLAAALALGRLRTARARRCADLAVAERDKLRADVAEANKRARLLAQDVDESHARMEAELAANLRRMEARHAEATRRATEETAAERDRAAALRTRLEADLARRTEAETRVRIELDAEKARGTQLEARVLVAEERATTAEREAARLAEEARRAREIESGGAAGAEEGPAWALAARVEQLRREAAALRDRNDELCALLEARPAPVAGATAAADAADAAGDLSAELRSFMAPEPLEECDSSPSSMDQKIIIDHREVIKRLRDIFEAFRAPSPASNDTCESCVAVEKLISETRARVQELIDAVALPAAAAVSAGPASHAAAQTDPDDDPLRQELASVLTKHAEEKQKCDNLIKELETGLEQMRDEYERCEEYWARKLDDERAAYDDERRAGDERLADLVARIQDYERSFAPAPPPPAPPPPPPPPRLPPIEERAALEAQVADLEREFAEHRARADAELRARDAELRRLREAAGAGAGGGAAAAAGAAAGAREAAALRARAARAEAAVRRLHARLQAADLLVKDLYVENCHLAHRAP